MDHKAAVEMIQKQKLIAILRGIPKEKTLPVAQALHEGGIRILEFTFDHNEPGYVEDTCEKIFMVKRAFKKEMLTGCGTVLSKAEAEAARSAGAQLLISPHTSKGLIRHGREMGMVIIPGAFTPTEIVKADKAGADFVKLFPAGELGLSYIKAIRAPLSHIPLLAVGGVKPENVGDFLTAGITGFGVGSQLAESAAIAAGDYVRIRERALEYAKAISAWAENT